MKYRPNTEKIKLLFFNIGQAIFIASLLYIVFEDENLRFALPLAIIGLISAIVGTLENKHD